MEQDFAALIRATRSVRRFAPGAVDRETLRALVDLARLSASGGNQQPLKFFLSCDEETNARIFPCTVWAASLKDWDGPAESERPAAYVLLLLDRELKSSAGVDHGIAAWSLCLGAREKGLGACMIGSIKRKELVEALRIPERYEVLLVVALGRPGETIVLEEAAPGESIAYYRTPDSVHHTPKRTLDEVIVEW